MILKISSSNEIVEKIKLVLKQEISVANEKGFVLAGPRQGDFSRTAYDSVKQKISLDDGQNTLWKPIFFEDKSMGALGIMNNKLPEETLNLISGMAEVIVYQDFLLKDLYSVTDIRANFLLDLLKGNRYPSLEDATHEADILKINLRQQQAVIIVKINNLIENHLRSLEGLTQEAKGIEIVNYIQDIELFIKKSFKDNDQNSVVYIDNDRFLILKGITGEKITTENSIRFFKEKGKYIQEILKEQFPGNKITVGVGQFYPGLDGLKKSFQDSKIALEVGIKVWGYDKVYHILDIGTFASLSGEISQKRKVEISQQVLEKLIENPELLKTIKTFLSSGMNLTTASKELHIHRNTLIYRLNKAKKIIGLDPKKFSDALQIKLGLLICQVK